MTLKSDRVPLRQPVVLGVYDIVTVVFAPILRAVLSRMHRNMGQDAAGRLSEREGRASAPRPEGPLVWINAASVGEVMLVANLVRTFTDKGINVLLTTTSATGAQAANENLPSAVIHQYLPLDLPGPVARFLDHWRPNLAVFSESDLWPRLWRGLAKRNVPIALVNLRASRSRKRFPRVAGYLLGLASLISVTKSDLIDELVQLGVAPDHLLTGDLRTDSPPLPANAEAVADARAIFADNSIWLAASTHVSDRRLLGEVARRVKELRPQTILIDVPRHPDRMGEIETAYAPLRVKFRSRGERPQAGEVYVADTMGELGIFFRLAPFVYLGGSMGDEEGHNPQEPAQLGCFVLHGPRVANHDAAYDRLEKDGRARCIYVADHLVAEVLARIDGAHMDRPKTDNSGITQELAARLLRLISDGSARNSG